MICELFVYEIIHMKCQVQQQQTNKTKNNNKKTQTKKQTNKQKKPNKQKQNLLSSTILLSALSVDLYHSLGIFSRQQADDIFLIFL